MTKLRTEARFKGVIRDLTWYRDNVPCMQACPVHTDSGRYVQLIGEERFEEAFLVARSPNPLASICGRVCAAPCEDACRRGWIDESVTIRPLKRFVTERYGAESSNPDCYEALLEGGVRDPVGGDSLPGNSMLWNMPVLAGEGQSSESPGRKVAVIGSGPAGLSCAHDLALLGHEAGSADLASLYGLMGLAFWIFGPLSISLFLFRRQDL